VESSALPVVEPSDQPSELAPLTILIEANGNVSLKDEAGTVELLETDSSKRDLPNVAARLKIYQMAADLTAAKPAIQLQVDPDALHRRVIDVLNVVTGAKISEITFIGLPKPDERD
jgi:biopolymer transport protein ExbD